jgi:radical SAM-linked protein
MRPVRMWIRKEGDARYISHLDLARCMLRAIRRARVPVWYTEGFNPHPYITFLAPLSLGIVGLREPMDLRLTGDMPLEEAVKRLDDVLFGGLSVVDAAEPVLKTRDIAAASYQIHLNMQGLLPEESAELVRKALAGDTLMVTKRTKSSEKQVNLLEYIHEPKLEADEEEAVLSLVLPAGSTENVNPSLVIDGLTAQSGMVCAEHLIVRTGLLDKEGKPFR